MYLTLSSFALRSPLRPSTPALLLLTLSFWDNDKSWSTWIFHLWSRRVSTGGILCVSLFAYVLSHRTKTCKCHVRAIYRVYILRICSRCLRILLQKYSRENNQEPCCTYLTFSFPLFRMLLSELGTPPILFDVSVEDAIDRSTGARWFGTCILLWAVKTLVFGRFTTEYGNVFWNFH